MTSKLEIFLKNKEFSSWYISKGFTQATEDNIHKYYMVFQREQCCDEKKCYNCAGIKIMEYIEEDILFDSYPQQRCTEPRIEPVTEKSIRHRKEMVRMLLARTHIPSAYSEYTIETIDSISEKTKNEINKFIENFELEPKKGLYLQTLRNNCGKTTLLWCIVKKLIEKEKILSEVLFFNMADFLVRLHEDSMTTEHQLYHDCINCGMLIFDDFSFIKPTQYAMSKIRGILEVRFSYSLPFLMSSALSEKHIEMMSDAQEKNLFHKALKMCKTISLDTNE